MRYMNTLRACALLAAIAAVAATNLNAATVGDAVGWANAAPMDQKIDQARDAKWYLKLPAQGDVLPAGATVKISSISVGERPSEEERPAKLRVYTNDTAYVDSEAFGDHAQLYGRLGNTTNAVRRLEYSFDSDLVLTVGTKYIVRLLNQSGEEQSSTPAGSAGSYCGAALVKVSGQALSMDKYKDTYSLVYAIKGEVVSNGAVPGWTATLSTDATAINFTENPSGNPTWAKISVTGNSELILGGSLSSYTTVTIDVAEGKTLNLLNTTISATTIEVTGAGIVSLAANDALSGTIVGNGTVRYMSGKPSGMTIGEGWCGTVKLSDTESELTNINPNDCGNAVSTVTFNGIQGYCLDGKNYFYPCVDFEDNGTLNAFRICNGYSSAESIFTKIIGSGRVRDIHSTTGATHLYRFLDVSGWSGSVVRNGGYGKRFVFGNGEASSNYGTITIASDAELTLGSSAMLGNSSDNGIYVYGMLDISAASFDNKVFGSGTIVCSGKLPNGVYTNEGWTGTVAISDIAPTTSKSGVLYPFNMHLFGNTNSTVRLASIGSTTLNSCYLPGSVTVGRVVLVDNGGTPALRLSDGLSKEVTTFCELAGSGTFTNINSAVYNGLTINVMTNFSGTLSPGNMTVTFGTAKRSGRDSNNADTDAQKKLFIDPDAVVSVPAGLRLWAPENGVVFNGPVNFTTSETDFSRLVLFANIGIRSKVEGSGNLQNLITVNGVVPDWTKYLLRFEKSNLVMKKRRNCRIILR